MDLTRAGLTIHTKPTLTSRHSHLWFDVMADHLAELGPTLFVSIGRAFLQIGTKPTRELSSHLPRDGFRSPRSCQDRSQHLASAPHQTETDRWHEPHIICGCGIQHGDMFIDSV